MNSYIVSDHTFKFDRAVFLAGILFTVIMLSGMIKLVHANQRVVMSLSGQTNEKARLVAQFNGPAMPIGEFFGDINFSKDGKLLATPGSDEFTQVWETISGRLIREFPTRTNGVFYDEVLAVAISDDNELLARSSQHSITIFNIISGEALIEIPIAPISDSKAFEIELLSFSPDRRELFVTIKNADGQSLESLAIEIDSKQIISRVGVGQLPNAANLLDPAKYPEYEWGNRLRSIADGETRYRASRIAFESEIDPKSVRIVAIDPHSDLVAAASGGNVVDDMIRIVSLGDGREVSQLKGFSARNANASAKFLWRSKIESALSAQNGNLDEVASDPSVPWEKLGRPIFSSAHRIAVFTSKEDESGTSFELIRCPSGQRMRTIEWTPGSWALAVSDNGKSLTVMDSGKIWIINVKTGKAIKEFPAASIRAAENVNSAMYAWDDRTLALFQSRGETCFIVVWDIYRKTEVGRLAIPRDTLYQEGPTSLAVSADRRFVAAAFSQDYDVRVVLIFELSSGRITARLPHPAEINEINYSPSGKFIATNAQDRIARIWDVSTEEVGTQISDAGSDLQFSSDEIYVFSDSVLFRLADSEEVCRFFTFSSGLDAIVSPDGRFDVNNFDDLEGLHWVLQGESLTTLPLEIFMRQYFEPGLLPRLLKCNQLENCDQEFKPLPPIAEINRSQPLISKPIFSMENSR